MKRSGVFVVWDNGEEIELVTDEWLDPYHLPFVIIREPIRQEDHGMTADLGKVIR